MRYRWKDTSEIERATKRRKKEYRNPVAKSLKEHKPKIVPDKRSNLKGNKGNLKHELMGLGE